MMSRKHYEASADIFARAIDFANLAVERQAIAAVARGHARVFKADNPRFSYEKFYAACGLNSGGTLVRAEK